MITRLAVLGAAVVSITAAGGCVSRTALDWAQTTPAVEPVPESSSESLMGLIGGDFSGVSDLGTPGDLFGADPYSSF